MPLIIQVRNRDWFRVNEEGIWWEKHPPSFHMHIHKTMVKQLGFHNLLSNGCGGLDPSLVRLLVLHGNFYWSNSLFLRWYIIAYWFFHFLLCAIQPMATYWPTYSSIYLPRVLMCDMPMQTWKSNGSCHERHMPYLWAYKSCHFVIHKLWMVPNLSKQLIWCAIRIRVVYVTCHWASSVMWQPL